MKRLTFFVAVTFILALTVSAFAGDGNNAPSGAHYNLNLIGVDNPKNSTMTGSDRHTIFVWLGSNATPKSSKIWLTRGDFQVCDGNSWDTAYDCNGNPMSTVGGAGKVGAVFQLPCNQYIQAQAGEDLVPCDPNAGATATYTVWVRARGTPGGTADWKTCATYTVPEPDVLYCNTYNDLIVRYKKNNDFTDVTYELTSLLAQIDDDPNLERIQLFAPNFVDWYWEYINKGVKLSQLRFYLQ